MSDAWGRHSIEYRQYLLVYRQYLPVYRRYPVVLTLGIPMF
jgi:hypothetical protein